MARLRNPSAQKLVVEMFGEIASTTRTYVQAVLNKEDAKSPEIFYWRGRGIQKSRKVSSVSAIPNDGITPVPSGIGVVTRKGENIAHLVAQAFASKFRAAAPRRTGRYADSDNYMLNGRIRALSSIVRYGTTNPFTDKEIVTIYSGSLYASKLESDYYRRNRAGIWRKIALELIAQFGSKASIRFTYISGSQLSAGFVWMTPVILIGAAGAFPSNVSRPGYQHKRRSRRAAKQLSRARSGRPN
jgi:hypothetical protein